jgi:hypothetical protein
MGKLAVLRVNTEQEDRVQRRSCSGRMTLGSGRTTAARAVLPAGLLSLSRPASSHGLQARLESHPAVELACRKLHSPTCHGNMFGRMLNPNHFTGFQDTGRNETPSACGLVINLKQTFFCKHSHPSSWPHSRPSMRRGQSGFPRNI